MAKDQKKDKKKKTKPGVLADEEYNRTWPQEKKFKFIRKLNDPRFGEIGIVKNPQTKQVLMIKEKMATSKSEAAKDINDLKGRMRLNHPNMLRLVDYSTTVKKELCSTSYLTKGFYEFPRTDMKRENMQRKKVTGDFSGQEIHAMGNQVMNGLNHLHSKKIAHGDIRPQNIGYNKAEGSYKILDRLSDPSPIEKSQMNNIITKKDIYMSPQLYSKL